MYGHISS